MVDNLGAYGYVDENDVFTAIPDVAVRALEKPGIRTTPLGDGVDIISGHDRGVGYRFFVHDEYNLIKSKAAGYPVYDSIEMIQWVRDRRHKPTERVRFLPDELLSFDTDGECVGGQYREAYLRFKEGKKAPGMPLDKWDVLSSSEVATLAAAQIYTVEQFADIARSKIEGKYPPSFVEAQDRAIQWVRGMELREKSAEQAEELSALNDANKELLARVAELEKQHKQDIKSQPKRGRGRPKKGEA